jgi:RecA-family ATPase
MVRTVSLKEYCHIERPSLHWLLPGFLPQPGFLLLLGEPFIGKSFLALQLSLALAQGQTFLRQRCRPSRVLYLQFDTSELVWKERLQSLVSSGVELPDTVYMVHPEDQKVNLNILNPSHQQYLTQLLAACQPHVVVIDVLREIHQADEQDSTQMKAVGDALMSLFQHRTLIVLHHTRKIDDDAIITRLSNVSRGSSYITGKADATWLLHKGQLYTESRFAPRAIYTATRLPNGFFAL